MKSIKCSQQNAQIGNIVIKLRFIGSIVYIKTKESSPLRNQMIEQLRGKGAEIIESETGWIRANMFKNQTRVKMGNAEFDVTKLEPEQLEEILYNFFKSKYLEAKFIVEDVDENTD